MENWFSMTFPFNSATHAVQYIVQETVSWQLKSLWRLGHWILIESFNYDKANHFSSSDYRHLKEDVNLEVFDSKDLLHYTVEAKKEKRGKEEKRW